MAADAWENKLYMGMKTLNMGVVHKSFLQLRPVFIFKYMTVVGSSEGNYFRNIHWKFRGTGGCITAILKLIYRCITE
jgi:hypothetical protein